MGLEALCTHASPTLRNHEGSRALWSKGPTHGEVTMPHDGLPTGEGTSKTNDVFDPHPATEEDYDKIPHPGGVRLRRAPDIGPNTYTHDGEGYSPAQKTGL